MAAQLGRMCAGFHGSGRGDAVRRDGTVLVNRGLGERAAGPGNLIGPGPVLCEAEVAAAAGGDELGRGREQPKPQAAGLPPTGYFAAGV